MAPNQENPFKGATLEQVANILSLQLFLHELLVDDCCVHTELVQSAYIYVNTVACYAAQMLHTEEEINMFLSFDDIGSRCCCISPSSSSSITNHKLSFTSSSSLGNAPFDELGVALRG